MKQFTHFLIALLALGLAALPAVAQEIDDDQDYNTAQQDEVPLLTTPGMTYGMGYGWGQQYGDRGFGTPHRTGYHDMDMELTGMPLRSPVGIMSELDLTQEQRDDILDIHEDLQRDRIEKLRELREKREEMMELHSADDFDREEMREVMVEMAEIRSDLYSEVREAQKEALDELTPEQREKLGERGMFGMDKSPHMKMKQMRQEHMKKKHDAMMRDQKSKGQER